MNSPTARISVVVPCYNQALYAYECIQSTKNAYSGPLQIIIVNDGSTIASTLPMLEALASSLSDDRCSIEIITQQNRGLSGARNAGLSRAQGEFIQLLDCDDLLLPDKLDAQIRHFLIAANLDVSVVDCIYSNESVDRFERHAHLLADSNFDLHDFVLKWERGFSLPIHCALFRRSAIASRRFDERQRSKEDWLFWTNLVRDGARIAYIGGPGVVYRVHDASLCRASPDIGRQWLGAAMEIDLLVRADIPEFLDSAVNWYARSYAGAHLALAANESEPQPDQPISETKVVAAAPRPSKRRGASTRGHGTSSPRVSIVVPVYEHFDFLQRCLDSAVANCSDQVELVLVDDGSRDPRIKPLLQRYQTQFGTTVVFQSRNSGVSMTLNMCVAHARGEFVAFLDCDDMLAPNAIGRVLAYLDEHSDCDYVFTDRFDISDEDDVLRLARYGGYRDDRFTGVFKEDIVNGMVASHLKVIRKSAIERVGGFDASVTGVQDWALALSIAEFGVFGYLPEPLYYYRVHRDTVTIGDRRGQFQRTNIVRRRFRQRYLERGVFGGDAASRSAAPWRLNASDVDPRRLVREAKVGPIILDATGDVTSAELWTIREFNSYFDTIEWSAPEIYAALVGYVWSPNILEHIGASPRRTGAEN